MRVEYPPVVAEPVFFIDYDGTLAPIVDDPEQAYPHPEVPELLRELDARYPLFLVTGRHLDDLDILLGMSLRAIGLHGAQEGRIGGETRILIPEQAKTDLDQMRATVPDRSNLLVEDKGHAFAVHYRNARDETRARAELETWATGMPESLEAIWGKKVVELRPKGINKGVAVSRICDRYPDRIPVYAGDDVTDEDAFRALHERAVTIHVGAGPTEARYRLHTVDEVVAYLKKYSRP